MIAIKQYYNTFANVVSVFFHHLYSL